MNEIADLLTVNATADFAGSTVTGKAAIALEDGVWKIASIGFREQYRGA